MVDDISNDAEEGMKKAIEAFTNSSRSPVGGVPAIITCDTVSGERLAYSRATTPKIE